MEIGRLITDIEAFELTAEEKNIIAHPQLGGIILFTRNFESKTQLKQLCKSIRLIKKDALIAVDHEGGRIQRFTEGFSPLPSMRYWGEQYKQDPILARKKLQHTTKIMVTELQQVGINLSFAPVLDLDLGQNTVISDRSFNADPSIVTELAAIVINEMQANNMWAVAKHFPGHGGVSADSHVDLPIDPRSLAELTQQDLIPFAKLAQSYQAIMPAHIIYPKVDSKLVTYSSTWLNTILRQKLKFSGIIISDDLTMEAASCGYRYSERARNALISGCDLLINCNNRAGSIEILKYLIQQATPLQLPKAYEPYLI